MKKNLHIWNRRSFTVVSAGFFTVLKPSGWFAASPLPGGFRYQGGQPTEPAPILRVGNSAGTPSDRSTYPPHHAAQGHPEARVTSMLSPGSEWNTQDSLMRPAFVVLAATAIASILLWWIAFPRFHSFPHFY